jgi:hypothetical protein
MVNRSLRGSLALALLALPSLAVAQSGQGFLFKKPNASFTMRAGYEAANTSDALFAGIRRDLTIGPRDFDAFNFGADLNYFLSSRTDLVFTLDLSSRTTTGAYRGGWEENGRPITHDATLDRAALGAGMRINLLPRGRQISALAYIPTTTLPYIGATGGVLWYEFAEKGDFIQVTSDTTADIFNDELRSNHYTLMGQVYAGVERRINARWSLVGETRFTQARAKLVNDYADLEHIQLSGLAFNLGATVRF